MDILEELAKVCNMAITAKDYLAAKDILFMMWEIQRDSENAANKSPEKSD